MSSSFTLESLGWDQAWKESFQPSEAQGLEAGRVVVEDKHRYVVVTSGGELSANLSGKLLHRSPSPAELPKVGDWVAFTPYRDEAKAVIQQVLTRRTKLSRKLPGRKT